MQAWQLNGAQETRIWLIDEIMANNKWAKQILWEGRQG